MLQTLAQPLRRALLVTVLTVAALSGCALRPQTTSAEGHCYTESGWLDSSNGCAARAGYPDCYLVCPETNVRRRL